MAYASSPYVSPRLTRWPRNIPLSTRAAAFLAAVTELIWLDLCALRGFRFVRAVVSAEPVAPKPVPYDAVTLVRVAMRDACLFYVKPVHCLQGSAAVTRMLRRRGVPAQLVIGCQAMPIGLHAWVELDGKVLWQGGSGLKFFRTVDRI